MNVIEHEMCGFGGDKSLASKDNSCLSILVTYNEIDIDIGNQKFKL